MNESRLNKATRNNIRTLVILLGISYLLAALFGLTINEALAEEIGSKYSCFRYDVFEPCSTAKYFYNSLLIVPRHILLELPIGMLMDVSSLFSTLADMGIAASLIIVYHLIVIVTMLIKIINSYRTK